MHWPLPRFSACPHAAEIVASHLRKSVVVLPACTALTFTFKRHAEYSAAARSLRSSHCFDLRSVRARGASTRVLARVEQVGSGPPASALATPSVHRAMNAWIAGRSLLERHCPLTFLPARLHLSANRASHLVKTGVRPAVAALASALRRQEPYPPDARSRADSHLPGGASAPAFPPNSRTEARAAVARAIVVLVMMVSDWVQ